MRFDQWIDGLIDKLKIAYFFNSDLSGIFSITWIYLRKKVHLLKFF